MTATEKIYKLMWEIKEDYKGIIPEENINTINNILLNTIKSIKEQEITFESHPITFIQMLEQEVEDNHPSRLTSMDIDDVSDNYQAHLEYKWWKEEQLEIIKDLKSKLTPEQLEWYNSFNDDKNESE